MTRSNINDVWVPPEWPLDMRPNYLLLTMGTTTDGWTWWIEYDAQSTAPVRCWRERHDAVSGPKSVTLAHGDAGPTDDEPVSESDAAKGKNESQ
jgi:hypothetical protein